MEIDSRRLCPAGGRFRLALVALALGVAPTWAQETAVHTASGVVTLNGKTLELQSAVAVWDDADKAILIGLFPFEVDERDARIVVESGAQALASIKPSPDPSIWKKTPLGAIIVRFGKRPKELKLSDLEGFSIRASWLDDPNSSFGVGRRTREQFEKEVNELGGELAKDGGVVKLLTAGSEYYSGGRFSWNVRVESTIQRPARRR